MLQRRALGRRIDPVCIGTRHCDIPEVIVNGQTSYLCNEGNIVAMSDIFCMLGKGPDRLVELTKHGRRHVEQNFSVSTQSEKMNAIYHSLLNAAVCRH